MDPYRCHSRRQNFFTLRHQQGHRIAVLAEGRLGPAVPKAQTNAEKIGMQMSGLFADAHATDREPAHAAA